MMLSKLSFVLYFSCLASASVLMPAGEMSSGIDDNVVEQKDKSGSVFEECLRKDSISCVQMQIFRMAKEFFDRPSMSVWDGVTLAKRVEFVDESRAFGNQAEEKMSKARSVVEKEDLLESYVFEEAANFFEKRNVNWNVETLARNLAPEKLKATISDFLSEEGRGKRKKVLRMLLPFLLGLKVKLATILGLSYLGVILLAKKALLLSVVSFAISVFLLVKKMFHHPHEDVYPYGHPGHGWQSHSDVGHVEYAAHAAPPAHNLAYSGQKP